MLASYASLHSEFRDVLSVTISITMFGSSLQLFVGGFMFYLRYLCLFAYSGVQHILCCVFLRLVYPMLPVSLDSPFLIAPTVFSNVYVQ